MNNIKDFIIIEPMAGLCNRMRALDSAIQTAEKVNKKIHLIWNLNVECNCKFEDLFNIPQSIKKITYYSSTKIVDKLYMCLIKYIISDKCFSQKDMDKISEYGRVPAMYESYRNVYISTYSRFYSYRAPFVDFLPVEPIKEIVNALCVQLNNTIGVHIRRADNHKAILKSPTELFVKEMFNELQKDKNVNFFVATDSPTEQAKLVSIFGAKIVTRKNNVYDRNEPTAIKNALVDLYCLSQCRKIFGSYWSSFSETASELNGTELQIIKTE